MAERLMVRAAALLLALGASSAGQAALAQAPDRAMRDPMRPAQGVAAVEAPKAVGAGAQAAPSGPRLQSVLISPNRRLAVIDGATVGIGAQVGDATLTAITESEVVLSKNNVRETLRLSPGVEKKPVPRLAPGKVTQ